MVPNPGSVSSVHESGIMKPDCLCRWGITAAWMFNLRLNEPQFSRDSESVELLLSLPALSPSIVLAHRPNTDAEPDHIPRLVASPLSLSWGFSCLEWFSFVLFYKVTCSPSTCMSPACLPPNLLVQFKFSRLAFRLACICFSLVLFARFAC